MKIFIILAVIGVVSSSLPRVPSVSRETLKEWKTFKMVHNKMYKNKVEEEFRLLIFMDNKRKIDDHNRAYGRGEVSYRMAMNHFGDLVCVMVATADLCHGGNAFRNWFFGLMSKL